MGASRGLFTLLRSKDTFVTSLGPDSGSAASYGGHLPSLSLCLLVCEMGILGKEGPAKSACED